MADDIESTLKEVRVFPPPESFAQAAHIKSLGEYRGLIKTYTRPFTAEEHDALSEKDYILVTWKGGRIVPVAAK